MTCTLIIAVINTMPGPARGTRGQDTGGVNTRGHAPPPPDLCARGGECLGSVKFFDEINESTEMEITLKWMDHNS